jgi:hypothetical protein
MQSESREAQGGKMTGYFGELSKVFERKGSNRLTEELKRVVGELAQLPAGEPQGTCPASRSLSALPQSAWKVLIGCSIW